jgi:hypothetical protein
MPKLVALATSSVCLQMASAFLQVLLLVAGLVATYQAAYVVCTPLSILYSICTTGAVLRAKTIV